MNKLRNTLRNSYLPKEKISSKSLQIVYGDEITTIIKKFEELKNDSQKYFNNINNEFIKIYKEYNTTINNNIENNAQKVIQNFKLDDLLKGKEDKEKKILVQKFNQEKVNCLNSIISLHSKIFDNLKNSVNSLKFFLDVSKNIEKGFYNKYLEKDFESIIKNWLFLKLDFSSFDFANQYKKTQLEPNFKDFISKMYRTKKNKLCMKFNKYLIDKEKNLLKEKYLKEISENKEDLTKLKMINVSECDSYFNNIISLTKMRQLLLDNVTFKINNVLYLFPYLSKLKIKNCFNLDTFWFKNISTHLKKLYLIKNGLVNYELNTIMEDYLIKSQSIRDNLEVLSFANNNISKIEFSKLLQKYTYNFRALKILDLKKNKISYFNFNKINFPALKIINLCKNYFDRDYFKEDKDIIILQSGNNFLTDFNNSKEYYNKLKIILVESDTYNYGYLNISYMQKKLSNNYFNSLKINKVTLVSLKKLDLSYNNLTNENILKFFSINKDQKLNIKCLNLNGNLLDDAFFEEFLEEKLNLILPKLKHLYISSNQIGSKNNIKYKDDIPIKDKLFVDEIYKVRLMYKFIKENKKLNKMNITKNPISEIYTIVPGKNADISNEYIVKDAQGKIIINCFFSFLIKIRDELLNKDEDGERNGFEMKFDCRSNINRNSENYPYGDKPILFKSNNK